jgi:hypothetical protein
MYKLAQVITLLLLLIQLLYGQDTKSPNTTDLLKTEKLKLVSEIQLLAYSQLARLSTPLARARAKAEIADVLWILDDSEAKVMLTEAYELTFHEQEHNKNKGLNNVTDQYNVSNEEQRSKAEIRNRILQIATRDSIYLSQLLKLTSDKFGNKEAHRSNKELAKQLINDGNDQEASKYIIESIKVDPTNTDIGSILMKLRKKSPGLAEQIIIKYIEQLRGLPFTDIKTQANIYILLEFLVFSSDQDLSALSCSPLIKAYTIYVIDNLNQIRKVSPTFLIRSRLTLIKIWPIIRECLPALIPAFLELEPLSRARPDNIALPTEAELRRKYDRQAQRKEDNLQKAIESETPDYFTIKAAVNRELFQKARNMISKMNDGPDKSELIEFVDVQESLYLIKRNRISEAEKLAQQIKSARKIYEVYTLLIEKCAKDKKCILPLAYMALNQLKEADNKPPLPVSFMLNGNIHSSRTSDPKLLYLSKLAKTTISIEDSIFHDVVSEIVRASNESNIDSDLGILGYETDIFKLAASKDETYARQTANNIKDPLRYLTAVLSIYQWKAAKLTSGKVNTIVNKDKVKP